MHVDRLGSFVLTTTALAQYPFPELKDLVKFFIESKCDPINLCFNENILLPRECMAEYYPGFLQCLSEDSVSITLVAISTVYTSLRSLMDHARAFQLLTNNHRYISRYTSMFDEDARTIWNMVDKKHHIQVIQYSMVRQSCSFGTGTAWSGLWGCFEMHGIACCCNFRHTHFCLVRACRLATPTS